MPELPEVETVRRQLEPAIAGAVFVSVEAIEPFMLRDCTAADLVRFLPRTRVETVERLGKFLLMRLVQPSDDTPLFLTIHLGMTGQMLVGGGPVRASFDLPVAARVGEAGTEHESRHRHTRFVFRLLTPSGLATRLEMRDARKFGRIHLTVEGPAPRMASLGPDAWTGSWDATYLKGRLEGRRTPLKSFLLDQRHLAGIGNIYADEILWWSGLSPLRLSGSLSADETERLALEIRRRLTEGVRALGCTLSDFVDTEGRSGGFQEHLEAYGRHGQPCRRCGTMLARIVVAGRGTAYCPNCQS